MNIKAITTTKIFIEDVPQGASRYEVMRHLEKKLKRFKYECIDYENEEGFSIAFKRYIAPFSTEYNKIAEIACNAIPEGLELAFKKDEEQKFKMQKEVEAFKFRNLGKCPDDPLAQAAWKDVADHQKIALERIKEAKKLYADDPDEMLDEIHSAIMDMPAYYQILDTALTGNVKATSKVAYHQDTFVREGMEYLWDYIETKAVE